MKVISDLRKAHRCPQCGFPRVKRESVGVWRCGKCDYTFTGGAYTPSTKLGVVSRRIAKGKPEEKKFIPSTVAAEEELD